jgi:hypothetical protein
VTLNVNTPAPIRVILNTLSTRNARAGFDGALRVATILEREQSRPPPGVYFGPLLDYERLYPNAAYRRCDQVEMENLLLGMIQQGLFAEAWGCLFGKNKTGLHQVHCRRASCAVPTDLHGSDGALRIYHDDENASELLLFKFCGQ